MNKYQGYGILNMNQMTLKVFKQILDKATLWTVLDGQLPNFWDIGRILDRFFFGNWHH